MLTVSLMPPAWCGHPVHVKVLLLGRLIIDDSLLTCLMCCVTIT
jgi:hypothetical protein